MKKILIWSLILVLAAVVSVIGTIAYFTAVDEEVNVMVVDDARIEIVEYERVNTNDKNTNAVVKEFRDNKPLIPSVLANGATYAAPDASYNANLSVDNEGNAIKANYSYPVWNPDNIAHEIDKMVFVKNTGDCSVYVRLCFAFEAGNYVRRARFEEMVHLNKNTTDWTWTWNDNLAEIDGTRCFIAWATYKYPVAPGELTDISLAQIALDHTAINDHARAFGDTYDVKVFAQGIQSDGFTSASAALSNGFGDTIPFKNVKFLEFADLTTALQWLNAIKHSTRIGGDTNENYKVNTITFGLTSEHSDVAKSYSGVLVANVNGQADFTAYAYYVPTSDGKYDIYVLADNWKIYTPNDSGALFKNMAALTKVDTSNLNVSDTTIMSAMFQSCKALTELDVSHWDVSNVTGMDYMFSSCGIKELDVSNWNVEKVTTMQQMFSACKQLHKLDCSNWNVDNVKSMKQMFHNCNNVIALDLSNWNVSKVESMYYMFSQCFALETLDVSGWDFGDDATVQVTSMNSMFHTCKRLKTLDVSSWNVSRVTDMGTMFYSCSELTSLNVSAWNVNSVTNMANMFRGCAKLTELNVSKWGVENLNDASHLFHSCSALTTLDLSGWNVSKVTDMTEMFNDCKLLTTIYVSDLWTPTNVTKEKSSKMFYVCRALKGGAGTTYDESNIDVTYAHIDGGKSNPGYLTKKK